MKKFGKDFPSVLQRFGKSEPHFRQEKPLQTEANLSISPMLQLIKKVWLGRTSQNRVPSVLQLMKEVP